MELFEKPYFARRATVDRDGDVVSDEQDGADVAEVLAGQVLRGLCAGPLAQSFAEDPTGLGAFAAKVIEGLYAAWYSQTKA